MNKVTMLDSDTESEASQRLDSQIIASTASEIEIDQICKLNWQGLSSNELVDVAWIYYYFSVQFRENLEIARKLYPQDPCLEELDDGERDTDNLSPYPGVVAPGERVNHDEFMRRTLEITPIDNRRCDRLRKIGDSYLARTRAEDQFTRASSLSSYEDGGLERVFRSILQAPHWKDPLLLAFRHFLEKHIELDSDPEQGHGSLSRHLKPKARVTELWTAFKDSLIQAVPALGGGTR